MGKENREMEESAQREKPIFWCQISHNYVLRATRNDNRPQWRDPGAIAVKQGGERERATRMKAENETAEEEDFDNHAVE